MEVIVINLISWKWYTGRMLIHSTQTMLMEFMARGWLALRRIAQMYASIIFTLNTFPYATYEVARY